MKDFFISYNSADKQWAEWIAWQLEEAGYTTIIQAWDFRPGRNFVIDMQNAASEAKRTIAVLSSNYLNAEYTQPEWAAAFAQDPMGVKGIVLPIRVSECQLEGILSQIVYINLVGLAPENARDELLKGIELKRVKPKVAPSFPGAMFPPTFPQQQPSFPGSSPLEPVLAPHPNLTSQDVRELNVECENIKKLIINHRRRLQLREEQKAQQGIDTPPAIIIEIQDIETEIERLTEKLAEIENAIASMPPKLSSQIAERQSKMSNGSAFDPGSLESTEGMVPIDSPFYIERHDDKRFMRQLSKPGTTTTIIGARQMGKTSLLIRGIEAARKKGFSTFYFDFQKVNKNYLQDLDGFLHYLALDIAITFNISSNNVESVWQIPLGPQDRLTRFMEDYILKSAVQPVVLVIDEADQLAHSDLQREFFSLVRAWYTMRGFNPLWKKFSVAMAISTQPYLLIDNVNQSPFNVGTQIRLSNFTPEQIRELNDRHGTPLNEAELAEMIDLSGGKPFLVRQALYVMIDEDLSWAELMEEALHPYGPFGAHLRQYSRQKLQDPELVAAIKSILDTGTSSNSSATSRLISAGLIEEKGSGYQFQCRLYTDYFKGAFG